MNLLQAQIANEDALLQQQLHEQRQQHLQALQAEHSHKEQKGNQQVHSCIFIKCRLSLTSVTCRLPLSHMLNACSAHGTQKLDAC